MAFRFDCPNRNTPGSGARHDDGNGRAPRRKCSGCGTPLTTHEGRWGVFGWSKTANYWPERALAIRASRSAADRYAATLDSPGSLVVRWIPSETCA